MGSMRGTEVKKKMSPEEALGVLDQVASTFIGTRSEHVQISEAIRTLDAFLKNSVKDLAPKPPDGVDVVMGDGPKVLES